MDTDGNIRCLSDLLSRRFALAPARGVSTGGLIGLILLFIFFVICGAYFGADDNSLSVLLHS